MHQPLQANRVGQFGHQVGEQRLFHHGISHLLGFFEPYLLSVILTISICKPWNHNELKLAQPLRL